MPRTDLDEHRVQWGYTRYRVYDTTTGTLTFSVDSPREILRFDEVRKSVNTPGYRQAKKSGGIRSLPMNPFDYVKEVHSFPTGQVSRELNGSLNVWSGITHQPFPFLFPGFDRSLESLEGESQNRLLTNVKDQKVNLLNMLGERKQVSSMILESASRLAGAVRAAKNGNIVLAAKNLSVPYAPKKTRRTKASRQLADDWLALEFGWKPLVSDIEGALEFFASKRSDPPRAKASASSSSRYTRYADLTGSWGPPTRLQEYGIRTVKRVAYFSSSSEVLSDLSRLGVTNIPSALWELTPWSFVVDWFIRVGEFIDLLDAGYGLTFEKGCTTTFEKETMIYRCGGTRTADDGSVWSGNSTARSYRVLCKRVPVYAFGGPSITLGRGLSERRSLSAVSLLRQRIGK